MLIHEADESVPVIGLQEMNEFVNHDVLETFQGFLCEFRVHPDSLGSMVAGSPLGLHPFYSPERQMHPELFLPLFKKWSGSCPEFFSIPPVENGAPDRHIRASRHIHLHLGFGL